MVGLHVQLDVEYPNNDRVIDAGPMAELLYVRAMCFAKKSMRDGLITRNQLTVIGRKIPKVEKEAANLVDVGLWEVAPKGWRIIGWLQRNKPAAKVLAESERKRLDSIAKNHKRWHIDEGKTSPSCALCYPDRDHNMDQRCDPHSDSSEEKAQEEEEEHPQEETARHPRPDNLRTLRSVPAEEEYEEVDRSSNVISEYVRLAVQACRDRGTPIRHMEGFMDDQRKRCIAKPEFNRYQRDYPTAPANAVACWLHGDTHSQRNYA